MASEDPSENTAILVVTGTDTGVGKTITTAALATDYQQHGFEVHVVKLAQTGEKSSDSAELGEGDAKTVNDLTGIQVHEFARYDAPLAPLVAAQYEGKKPLGLLEASRRLADIARTPLEPGKKQIILIEGSGGALVPLGEELPVGEDGTLDESAKPVPWDLLDLAKASSFPLVLTTSLKLGTLNHTQLTVEAMLSRELECVGLVIGSLPTNDPKEADLAAQTNLDSFAKGFYGLPLLGLIPQGAGDLSREEFTEQAPSWFPQIALPQ